MNLIYKTMIYFDNDYMTGAHPEVLRALCETNTLHTRGYGRDPFTAQAREAILEACGLPQGEVYLLEGGTQTNKVVLDLRSCCRRRDSPVDSAHINVHEAGAIEDTGHKVIALPGRDGKLQAATVRKYVEDFYKDDTNIYMVRPAVVYISFPTELGTVYTRAELEALGEVCREFDMPPLHRRARMAYRACRRGAMTWSCRI